MEVNKNRAKMNGLLLKTKKRKLNHWFNKMKAKYSIKMAQIQLLRKIKELIKSSLIFKKLLKKSLLNRIKKKFPTKKIHRQKIRIFNNHKIRKFPLIKITKTNQQKIILIIMRKFKLKIKLPSQEPMRIRSKDRKLGQLRKSPMKRQSQNQR